MKVYRSSKNIDQLNLNEFIYFKIEANGSNNIALRGKTVGFCVDSECSIDNIKGMTIYKIKNQYFFLKKRKKESLLLIQILINEPIILIITLF